MSTAVPVTTDTLPSNVPKLDIKGTNWAIFSLRFQVAVEAKELWKYFNGSCPHPASPVTATEIISVEKWQKNENLTKHLLTQRIPNSTALRICNLVNVATMWAEIIHEYTEKGAYAQTDLRTKFLESKCPVRGDVRQFLDELRTKQDKLSAVGVDIEETDYRSTIIQSLPNHLAIFTSGQLATARLYSPTKTIDPDILISLIIEESERHTTRDARPPHNTRSGGADQALGVTDLAPRGWGGGRFRGCGSSSNRQGRPCPLCWNCGSQDHFKAACPEPDKSAGNCADTTRGSAHAAADDDDKDDGVFIAEHATDCDSVCSLPALLSTESSDDDATERLNFVVSEDDWFLEVEEDDSSSFDDWESQPAFSISGSGTGSFKDLGDPHIEEEFAAKVSTEHENGAIIELYDSGTTRHIKRINIIARVWNKQTLCSK
ncbi:hypothetical protein BDR03DRAFT_1018374 [Suillus americanus]|nr:hypothetical protein BDR03DRAFT_1018374 [Suillus americanus]